MRHLAGFALILLCVLPLRAEEAREFGLAAAPDIRASGLLDYILPRFGLKTGRRAQLVETEADVRIGPDDGTGRLVMARAGTTYMVAVDSDNEAARRFADWLTSETGQKAIAAFTPTEGPPFEGAAARTEVAEITFTGDVTLGREVADKHCARCHRVAPDETTIGIGSTPSFAALRALPDWATRFQAFYALNPHPAFMQVEGISPPFDPARPPPIVPVTVTMAEVEALQAFVATVAPADLGAEILSR